MTIICVSDLHVNSTMALWPKNFQMEDGNIRQLNKFQNTLHKWWVDFCERSAKYKDRIVVINGDIVQGIHSTKDSQIMTDNQKDQNLACFNVILPVVEKSAAVFFVRGTEWHENKGGQDAEIIANLLVQRGINVIRDDTTGQYTTWEKYLEVDNKIIHFTHHIGGHNGGIQPLRKELDYAKMRYYDTRIPVPHLMVRSHRHQYAEYRDANGRNSIIVTPSWQLKTAFVYKHNALSLPDIGGIIIHTEGEYVTWEKMMYELPKPQIWKQNSL